MRQLFINGKFYVEKDIFVEAVFVENGKIVEIGSNDKILGYKQGDTEVIDMQHRLVLPGFNDSHLHLSYVGRQLNEVKLHDVKSIQEVKQRLKAFIEKHQLEPGTYIHGMGWNQDYFEDEHRLLTRQDLDEVTTQHPVVLERTCAHILVANTMAIQQAGITKDSISVEGGAFDKDEQGELTGIFRENACSQVLSIAPKVTVQDLKKDLKSAMQYALKNGITSIQTCDMWEHNWQMMYQAYEELLHEEPMLRVYQQVNIQNIKAYESFLNAGYYTGYGNAIHKIGPLKLFIDGSLGGRTALLRQPYEDDPTTCGISTLTQQQLNDLVDLATTNKCQVAIHAIGDGAIERVLNSYQRLQDNTLRHGIVHCQITDEALLKRFAEQDILAYVQPVFLHYDMQIVEQRVGKQLASTSYAFKTLLDYGVHVSLGTDAPVEDMNPIANIHCAVNRQNLQHEPKQGFYPNECLSVVEAIDAYTVGSAYSSFEEHCKGRIKPGYYADFAVLDKDIFNIQKDEILSIQIVGTIVNGRWVFRQS